MLNYLYIYIVQRKKTTISSCEYDALICASNDWTTAPDWFINIPTSAEELEPMDEIRCFKMTENDDDKIYPMGL